MPSQETFLELRTGDKLIRVLKTYDATFAHEAFTEMNEAAKSHLWKSLDIENDFDPQDIPPLGTSESDDFLWEALEDSARETGSTLSFFVVETSEEGSQQTLYASPDWPSAEAFAKNFAF